MPEEIFIIIALSILSGTVLAMVKSVLNYKSSKHQHVEHTTGASLTTSELERLMQGAVEKATAPLAAQIDALERRLDANGRLLEAPGRLDEATLRHEDDFEAAETARSARLRRPAR